MDSKQRTELSLIEILRIKITKGKFRGKMWNLEGEFYILT